MPYLITSFSYIRTIKTAINIVEAVKRRNKERLYGQRRRIKSRVGMIDFAH